jgi:hypothetical protein
MWPDKEAQVNTDAVATAQAMYGSIHKLAPQNDEQRAVKAQALEAAADLSKTRWLLFAQGDTSIAKPLLIIVIVWLAITFLSFGLFAPSNKTVIVTMMVVALAVSSAIFLILEMDQPFSGVIQISSKPLDNALSHLGH